jgi:hypothetical protein
VAQDEIGRACWRRAVLEGANFAIGAADTHLERSKQHLAAMGLVRFRPFRQTDALLTWSYD